MVTVASAKEYLRIDGTAEDTLIGTLVSAASAYLAGAVDDFAAKYAADNSFAALADMLEYAYVVEAYRNRDAINDTRANEKHFSFMFFSQITQLQNWVVSSS